MAEVKGNIFVRTGKKIGGFFKGIFSELKKVSWPSRKQVFNNTASVLAFCFVVGLVIWLADFFFKFVIGLLFA